MGQLGVCCGSCADLSRVALGSRVRDEKVRSTGRAFSVNIPGSLAHLSLMKEKALSLATLAEAFVVVHKTAEQTKAD